MNKLLIALLALIVSVSLQAAEGFSSLEEQMTGKEFDAAGLDKLTPQELAALNTWIRTHSVATIDAAGAAASTSTVAGGDMRGLKQEKGKEDKTPITSRIIGKFSGWDGQTVFKLENGMIWAQADKAKFYTKETSDAVAVIEPGMFGTWRLHVEGHNSTTRVKRIQ